MSDFLQFHFLEIVHKMRAYKTNYKFILINTGGECQMECDNSSKRQFTE